MALAVPLINDGNVVGDIAIFEKNINSADNSQTKQEHESAVLHRSLHQVPLRVLSAKGNYLHLSNGQKIFDATGGAAVSCLGHGDERYDCPSR